MSNTSLMKKGLNYRFSLKDLNKYSSTLNAKDVKKRFSRSAMQKREAGSSKKRRKIEDNKNRWEFLRN
jgi:hypothetical protein